MPDQIISKYLQTDVCDTARSVAADVLVAESNHRIANNLTLIAGLVRLQAAGIARTGEPLSATDACLALEEIGNRIETVGRLHRLLAARGKAPTIDMSDYLREIAEAAVASMSTKVDMTLRHISTAECEIPTQEALAVGFVVGELVTNAVKYAHPTGVSGLIEVGCHRGAHGGTVIEVADDGIGLPEGWDPARDGGLGMRMVRSLARQLGAKLEFITDGIGLGVELALPAPPGV